MSKEGAAVSDTGIVIHFSSSFLPGLGGFFPAAPELGLFPSEVGVSLLSLFLFLLGLGLPSLWLSAPLPGGK